jgi:hypothetical protein
MPYVRNLVACFVFSLAKLIDKHALRLPAGDWFLARKNGSLVQYEKPSLSFKRAGAGWQAELLTVRWRERKDGKWTAWKDARPTYSSWRMATIGISTPATGGANASVTESAGGIETYTRPMESTVTQMR